MKHAHRLILLTVVLLAVMGVYVILATTQGARLVSEAVMPGMFNAEDIEIEGLAGDLTNGLSMRNVEFKNMEGLPAGSVVRIQRIDVNLPSLNFQDVIAEFENIRLFLPHGDPIVLSGHYRNGLLNLNVYSSTISVEEILSILPHKIPSKPTGRIRDIDLYVTGPVDRLDVKGKFHVEELTLPKFTLQDGPGDLELILTRRDDRYVPAGQLSVSQGRVRTKNAVMRLSESKLFFAQEWGIPAFDVKGTSVIGKTTIDVALKGTPRSPEWHFASTPSVPEQQLMLMFLTGKSLDSVATSIDQQKITPDLAKDLADYFLLGGEGGRLAEKLGIKDVSILYDDQTHGIGIKKELTDSIDVGYQVEQERSTDTAVSDIKHKLDAEIKLNRHLSIEVDKELLQIRNQENFGLYEKPDDRVLLKFKTEF